MEKELKIRTSDKHIIYGQLAMTTKKSDKLVIFCHGFTGNSNEHIFFNGARYFNKAGFDAFRFDFYNDQSGARHFEDTSLTQHGADITTVINYFKNKYKKIYVIGHSFGGTSLLFADTKHASGLVFWGASFIVPADEKKEFDFKKKYNAYTYDVGMNVIVGKKFLEELFVVDNCDELIKKITKPVLFVGAGKDSTSHDKYYKFANHPKAVVRIKEADHCFNTFASEEKLFAETLAWVKKVK